MRYGPVPLWNQATLPLDRIFVAKAHKVHRVHAEKGSVTPTIMTANAKIGRAVGSSINAKYAEPIIQKKCAKIKIEEKMNLAVKSKLPTPIKVARLSFYLLGYTNRYTLVEGFQKGFKLGYEGPRKARTSKNSLSLDLSPELVRTKIDKESQKGRVAGPFLAPPIQNLQCSPVALIPKKAPGEFRLIHNLSAPKGKSINDGIPRESATVKYQTLDQAFEVITQLGRGALLAKADIEDAFRLIPIHPSDYGLLGFMFQGRYFIDKCLPFGCASSCRLFEAFSSAIHWIMKSRYNANIVHIIDDFLFIAPPNTQKCKKDLTRFMALARDIGFPIKHAKTVWPTTCIEFMGIVIDTAAMEARLPQDKIDKCRNQLQTFLIREKATLKELQSLIGLLSFACKVVRPGRAFLRRLIDLTMGLKHPSHFRRLTQETKADIATWLTFLDQYNGKSIILDKRWQAAESVHLYSDASQLGFGCILKSAWCFGEWPPSWGHYHITMKELYPIVLALDLWGSELANQCIVFHCDNSAVVAILNKQTCKEKRIMKLVRHFVRCIMKFNILCKAVHIPGKLNVQADRLSRLQVDEFRNLTPWADLDPTPIPRSLTPESW